MCGIFGYVGPDDAGEVCLRGLLRLEYRGYDSAGLCGIHNDGLKAWKEVGKVHALENAWSSDKVPLSLAIAHTRWATHGKPSQENAHPHFDQHNHIAVIHNGIIENYRTLREQLLSLGIQFRSETDTEVIAQLIAYHYKGDLARAVQHTLDLLQGSWALAIIHRNHPNQIIATARDNPLVVGLRAPHQETLLSSDPNAFHDPDTDLVFLKQGELAVLEAGKITLFDPHHNTLQATTERRPLEQPPPSKGDFPHFMLKEIYEQPETLSRAIHGRLIEEFGTVEFENLHFSSHELRSIRRILILGCGTSWHAGLIAASMFEEKSRIPAQVDIASEFRCKHPLIPEHTLIIAVSQSGETLDTLAAVREAQHQGAKVLAICNVRNSTLTREADGTIFLRAGPEMSVCSTKAFTSQVTILASLALLLGRLRHMSKEEGQTFLHELRNVPHLAEQVLSLAPKIQSIARHYAHYPHFLFLGRHFMFPTCLEAALKLKEISYLNASGYPAGELKHGPIALLDEQFPVIALCGNHRTLPKMVNNLMEVKARGVPLLTFTFPSQPLHEIADHTIVLPECSDDVAPIPFSIATQLFAYYIALERGTDIDRPRNLAKSVTVE